MTWRYDEGQHILDYGEFVLSARLDPATPIPGSEGELGSAEHPFVWLFEGRHKEDGVEFRGTRETLADAQSAALQKAAWLLPDALEAAVGF